METTKWFDKDGNEIIRNVPNPNNLEPIAELGGSFEEFSVSIDFYSMNLDKDEITDLLGVNPTKAWNPNELHPMGNKGNQRMTNWGKWYVSSERDATDINDKLIALFSACTQDLDAWKHLTQKYEAWVSVAGYMHNWNRCFTLKTETMRLLVERGLEVVFDVYYYGEGKE